MTNDIGGGENNVVPFERMQRRETSPAGHLFASAVEGALARYVHVDEGGGGYDLQAKRGEKLYYTPQELGRKLSTNVVVGTYANGADRLGSLYSAWSGRAERISVSSLMFYPGKPRIFELEGVKYANSWLPRWREDELPSMSERLPFAFVRYMKLLVPNKKELRLLLKFFAVKTYEPAYLAPFAPILVSEGGTQGTGRSLFGNLMINALGYSVAKDQGDMTLAWANDASSKLLILLNEMLIQGSFAERRAFYDRFKSLVDQVNSLESGNLKYGGIITYMRFFLVMIFTNHAVPLWFPGKDCRRTFFVTSTGVYQSEEFYSRYAALFSDQAFIERVARGLYAAGARMAAKGEKLPHRAPMTPAKETAIRLMSYQDDDIFDEVIALAAKSGAKSIDEIVFKRLVASIAGVLDDKAELRYREKFRRLPFVNKTGRVNRPEHSLPASADDGKRAIVQVRSLTGRTQNLRRDEVGTDRDLLEKLADDTIELVKKGDYGDGFEGDDASDESS